MMRIYVHRPEHRDALRPFLGEIQEPILAWLATRLQELEECSITDLTPHSVMAVVAVSEPHFLSRLRTVVQPSVHIDDSDGVLSHIHGIMGKGIPVTHEPDTDQPSPF